MNPINKASARPYVAERKALITLSPELILLTLTILLFGYCLLYVSLPILLKASRSQPVQPQYQMASQYLPQAK